MASSIKILAGAAALVVALSPPVLAEGALQTQTVTLSRVDISTLTTGFRTSKLVGSSVFNEANELVGTVDDLIITPNDKVPYAVLSVGGFLGVGAKFVVVPAGALEVQDKRIMFRGATKDALKNLPNFQYNN